MTGGGRYGGVDCFTTEMRRGDGAVLHESCIAPHHGMVVYSAYNNVEESYRTVWIELRVYLGD